MIFSIWILIILLVVAMPFCVFVIVKSNKEYAEALDRSSHMYVKAFASCSDLREDIDKARVEMRALYNDVVSRLKKDPSFWT